MKILLDTHVIIALLHEDLRSRYPQIEGALDNPANESFFSTASLWEIAIKARLGKLDPNMALDKISAYIQSFGIGILPISDEHAVAEALPPPPTRDPSDRLLLAQCHVEGLRLATIDRALREHPLALRF